MHGRPHFSQRSMEGREAPADGVITGWGEVDGRRCAIVAYDFTVMAGSMGMTGEIKVARLREMALQEADAVHLAARLRRRAHPGGGRLAVRRLRPPVPGGGDHVRLSFRWWPACSGPVRPAPPTSPASPTSCRWSSGRASMALAGPHLVKAVTGEDVTQEELGGAKVHCRKSGVGDLEVADDRECIEAIKTYLSFFPSNCEQQPPIRETADPVDRMDEELLDIVPESPRHPYDMYDVIERIVDDGEYFDIKPKWAKTIITCFARFGGRPVGHRREPAEAARRHPRERLRRQGRALRQPVRRLQHPARLPAGRARLHGRHQGRAGGHHPPRRQDAVRGLARDRAEGHGRDPEGLRRGLLRDERQRLRAGPARRMAVGARSR